MASGGRRTGVIVGGAAALLVTVVVVATTLTAGRDDAPATQEILASQSVPASPPDASGAPSSSATPSALTSPSAVAAPLIPAASVLPTTIPTLPTVKPTPTARPTVKPTPRVPPQPRLGKFKVTEKVTKSNRSTVPVGHTSSFTWTLTVLCDPLCAVTDPGGDVRVKGRTWTYSFTSETVCYRTNSAGKRYDKRQGTTRSKVTLRFTKPTKSKPQAFSGTVKQRLKKECKGYQGMWQPWSVDYKLSGKFAGLQR